MEEKQRRRYCHSYHRPDGEELDVQREEDDDNYLEDPITLEPVPLEEDIVMFINERYNPENVVIECYTVATIRNTIQNLNIDRATGGVRNVLSATNRLVNRNFIEKFNRGDRTFILREGQNGVFDPIPINRENYFNLLNRIIFGEEGENPLQDMEEIQLEIQRLVPPPVIQAPPVIEPLRALREVVIENNIEEVRMLLENGVRDNLVLIEAARNNNMEMVRLLVENDIRANFALCEAVRNNNMEMVRFLVEHGMNDNTALGIAVRNNNMGMVRFLVENGMFFRPSVFMAVRNNNMIMVRFLVENGMRIDNVAIDEAVRHNNMEMERFLRENIEQQ